VGSSESELAEARTSALVLPDLEGADARAVLQELATALAEANPSLSAFELAAALNEREQLGSTALGGGVAIPHCRLAAIERLTIAIGRHRRGIDFGAADGRPVRLWIVLLAPVADPRAHLRVLADLARRLRLPGLVERVLAATSEEEILDELLDSTWSAA
jgi:PTS system nitrogen regulatory IIA component